MEVMKTPEDARLPGAFEGEGTSTGAMEKSGGPADKPNYAAPEIQHGMCNPEAKGKVTMEDKIAPGDARLTGEVEEEGTLKAARSNSSSCSFCS